VSIKVERLIGITITVPVPFQLNELTSLLFHPVILHFAVHCDQAELVRCGDHGNECGSVVIVQM